MSRIVLKGKYKIIQITKKSKAAILKDLKADDIIEIIFTVNNTGYAGCSASCEYKINNGEVHRDYLKKISDWMSNNCIFVEVK